ncbi:MAG: aminotransferase class IV [Sulfurimonas sp.]|nr:aminotransferase class IV [Sulfurimonas sp.]
MKRNSYLETIKAIDGELYNLEYHQKRYEGVLDSLGIEKKDDLSKYINPPEFGIYRCRLVYTDDTMDVSYHKYKKREVNSLKLVFNNDIEYSQKLENRDEINALFKLREECDDILIIKNLLICDTSIANVAFYRDGEWFTPKKPLLKGTTRARLIDEGKIIESNIKVQDIRSFSKVALLNAMIDFDVLQQYEILI